MSVSWLGPRGFRLRAVVLECPFNFMRQSPEGRVPPELELWTKLLQLKALGYGREYAYGVLPMDAADYVGNHIFLCEERPHGLEPQFGFKSITWQRCQTHHLEFPIFPLIRSSRNQATAQQVEVETEARIRAALLRGDQVGYNGSFTVHPEMRAQKGRIPFWNMALVMFARYYQTYGIRQVIAGAAAKFKVDREKLRMGFEYLPFEALAMEAFNGDPVHVMHLSEFSEEIKSLSNEPAYQELWESRLTLKVEEEYGLEQAA